MQLLVGVLALAVWIGGLLAYPNLGWWQHIPLVLAIAAFASRAVGNRPRVRPPGGRPPDPRTAAP